eukprot:TRINITY_DN31425_c0_g1_i1.p1 TRINITY_DN31425_c0_g1~~TRINITY_DN31425_c0_g1_i1.p1  ORF type:complete len:418 (-),score=104.77 TRINITY_DN31425_c0_g1_i1:62-1237(-)
MRWTRPTARATGAAWRQAATPLALRTPVLCGGHVVGCPERRRAAAAAAAAPLRLRLRALSSAAATPAASAAPAESSSSGEAKPEKKEKEEEKKSGWGTFLLYLTSGVSSVIVLWHFYKAEYSFHKTEILLVESWRGLPFYWPPGESVAAKNSRIDPEGLHPDVVDAFVQWFLANDLRQPEGVLRDDVLDLVDELGFSEKEKPIRDFLMRGGGELEEHRRLTGAGLQESISLLAQLARLPPPAEGEAARPEVGAAATALFKRKIGGVASVSAGASALMQAIQQPPAAAMLPSASAAPTPQSPAAVAAAMPTGAAAAQAAAASRASVASSSSSSTEAEGNFDEALQRRMEDARLARQEEELTARLQRNGSLSPAEEARLGDVRRKRATLAAQA